MPPAVRRVARPRPQTQRCRYSDDGGRCRRVATVGDGLCRQHAMVLELDLEQDDPTVNLLGLVDRVLAGRLVGDDLTRNVTTMLSSFLGGRLAQRIPPAQVAQAQAQATEWLRKQQRAAQARRAAPAQGPAATPPPPPPDPLLRAREILGFEPTEKLTRERVTDRKRALAKVYHPDLQGGSTAQMQRVLTAADALLAKLP